MNKNFHNQKKATAPSGKKAPRRQAPKQDYVEDKAYKAEVVKFYAKVVLVVVVAGLILASILFGFISCNFYKNLAFGGEETYTYSLELYKGNPDENPEKTALKHEQILISGGVYVPLDEIGKYCEYTVAGDSESISVIFGSSGGVFSNEDCAEFLIDSNCVRVNKNRITLDYPILYREGTLYIPFDFFRLYMSGFNCNIEKKGSRAIYSIYPNDEVIGYRLAESSAEYPPIETEYFPEALPSKPFVTDLSSYEEYMTPDNEAKYLVLANNSSRLAESYNPGELIDVAYTKDDGRPKQQLEKYAAMALEAMLKEASNSGCKLLYVTTGYRSYATQKSIYDPRYEANKAVHGAARAEAETIKAVSYPGASDHQTALGFDFDHTEGFAESNEYRWLVSNCADFGFILRYPQNKTDITGIDYEPWHFRFVGRYHAQNIMKEGLCLEEYLTKYASTLGTGASGR